MYGLPASFDVSRLLGCALEQVSFSKNTVHLCFSHQLSITIESSFMHSIPGQAGEANPTQVPPKKSKLMQLLGESIESAQASVNGTLSLTFTNGHRLVIYDDTPQYEAYRLTLGEEEVIV